KIIFTSQYTSSVKTFVIGQSALANPAILEQNLREIFLYGAYHQYQLSFDKNSYKRLPFASDAQKDELNNAIKNDREDLHRFAKHYKTQLTRGRISKENERLRNQVVNARDHYTY